VVGCVMLGLFGVEGSIWVWALFWSFDVWRELVVGGVRTPFGASFTFVFLSSRRCRRKRLV
jgi:hypothetical protein